MDDKTIIELKQLLRKGMSYKDIAAEMEITEATVRHIIKKLRLEREAPNATTGMY